MRILKPLRWIETDDVLEATSSLHTYKIRFSKEEGLFEVTYHSHISNKSGKTYKKTINDAMSWAEEVHYPHKMARWLVTFRI